MVKPKCDCADHHRCSCAGPLCPLCANDPRHGTVNGYINLDCRCEACRAVHRKTCFKYKKLRAAKQVPEQYHGTVNGYGNWGCRCEDCTAAWSWETRDRAYRARRGLTRPVKLEDR